MKSEPLADLPEDQVHTDDMEWIGKVFEQTVPLVREAFKNSGMSKAMFITVVVSVLIPGEDCDAADEIIAECLSYYANLTESQMEIPHDTTVIDVMARVIMKRNQRAVKTRELLEALAGVEPEGSA